MNAKLRIESGIAAGTEIVLSNDKPTVIGRAPHADFTVPDVHVSKSHCHVVLADQRWTVTDLNSSNGTFVNDRRVKTLSLADGDVVRLGKTTLRFSLEPETASASKTPEPAKGEGGLFKLLERAESPPPASAKENAPAPAAEPPRPTPAGAPNAEPPTPTSSPRASEKTSDRSDSSDQSDKSSPAKQAGDGAGELFSLIKDKLRRGGK